MDVFTPRLPSQTKSCISVFEYSHALNFLTVLVRNVILNVKCEM